VQKTKGGIYLKEAPKGNNEAVVVAVGQGLRTTVWQIIYFPVRFFDADRTALSLLLL
jgi:co-chaperonin GroES (HSP10)